MRMTLGVLAGLVIGAGVSMSPGRAPAVDMVSARYSGDVPNPTHLGHWAAPVSGRPVFIAPNFMEPGTGDGGVTFGVMVGGAGTVCAMSAPCDATPVDFSHHGCAEVGVAAGVEVHLEFSHTCDTPPAGNVVFGFEWSR
jgi:hypothetical protein